MKIGEKQISILDSLQNKFTIWHASKVSLHDEIIYIERELVGLSNSGSDIYFQYKLKKNNADALPLIINDCQCTAVYSDIWVHRVSIEDERNIFHFRDFHPEINNTDDVIFMPFEKNLGLIQLSYGEMFTIARLADKKNEEKIILLLDIFKLVETLRALSYCDSWADFLANQFVDYFDSEFIRIFNFYFNSCTDWNKHYVKYPEFFISDNQAQDSSKNYFISQFEVFVNLYLRSKAKYLNLINPNKKKEIEIGFEKKIKLYREVLSRK